MATENKEVTVKLEVKEIVYDVRNKTYLTGESRMAEGSSSAEAGACIQASEDEGHLYQIYRSISNAFAQLKSELGEYLKEDDGDETTNLIKDTVEERRKLTLEFVLPGNFNTSASDSLGSCIHEYLVNKAVCEWFILTNRGEAEVYAGMANVALQATKKALHKRERPKRPEYPA